MKVTTKALVAIAAIAMTTTAAQAAPSFSKMQGGQSYVGARLNSTFGVGFGGGLGGTVYGGYEVAPNVSVEAAVSPSFGNGVTMVRGSVTGAYRHSLQNVIQAPVYVKGKVGIGAAYTRFSTTIPGVNDNNFSGPGAVWGIGVGYDIAPDMSVELDANTLGGGIGLHKKF